MSQVSGWRCACLRALACASLFLACSAAVVSRGRDGEDGTGPVAAESARSQLVVRLRSFVPGATGRVEVEPSEAGGRVRLLASRLPAPGAIAPDARAYVVWATGGHVLRVGELRRDARGDASFEFAHPAGFQTYTIVVTAERDARADRPAGAFVFSTRAGEVAPFYPPKPEPAVRSRTVNAPTRHDPAPTGPQPTGPQRTGPHVATNRPAPTVTAITRPAAGASASEFYESIDSAVADPAGARTLDLAGVGASRRASGEARVATREGTAYVRVRFRRVPSAARYGVRKYVMWADVPADGPVFLRALPARGLNRRPTYARRPGLNSTDFRLLVTAERRYPRPRPRGRRVMTTVNR